MIIGRQRQYWEPSVSLILAGKPFPTGVIAGYCTCVFHDNHLPHLEIMGHMLLYDLKGFYFIRCRNCSPPPWWCQSVSRQSQMWQFSQWSSSAGCAACHCSPLLRAVVQRENVTAEIIHTKVWACVCRGECGSTAQHGTTRWTLLTWN